MATRRTRRSARAGILGGLIAAALVATPIPAPAASGAAQGLRLVYDVYYLAFRILAVDSTTFVEPESYRAHSHMQTVGLIGTLFPWESRSSVFGSIDGPELHPGGYQHRSTFRGNPIEVDLTYGEGGSVAERVSGDYSTGRRKPVPEQARVDTLDPLTAAVAISHTLARDGTCSGTQRVFDGVRRYDLSYEDLGDETLEAEGDDGFAGRARPCKARFQPIGGFLETGPWAGESPRQITAWLATTEAGSPPVPVRLEFEGPQGTLHAYLQKAALVPAKAAVESAPAPAAGG